MILRSQFARSFGARHVAVLKSSNTKTKKPDDVIRNTSASRFLNVPVVVTGDLDLLSNR
jgi:hypothetical protein